jgi:hypothetical protein
MQANCTAAMYLPYFTTYSNSTYRKHIKSYYRYNHGRARDAYMEAGAARATTSGLLMLAGRISGDSTNCELPHRKGRNLTALYVALRLALV